MRAMIASSQMNPTTNAASGGPKEASGVARFGFEMKGIVQTAPKRAAPL